VISTAFWQSGFYYSSDYGETIELRDSLPDLGSYQEFGPFVKDADEGIIHRFHPLPYGDHLITNDAGFNWEIINNDIADPRSYASGIISGEIYRVEVVPYYSDLERSENYGSTYTPCQCAGFDEDVSSVCVGSDTGEVFILSNESNLYYSSDFAEHCTFLADLDELAGIYYLYALVKGAEPGEIYVRDHDSNRIWRVPDYGNSADLIVQFSLGVNWHCGMATSDQPGEMYYLAVDIGSPVGGTMMIYHTTDYFQTWTEFQHVIDNTGLAPPGLQLHPRHGVEFTFGPNPANPSFWINYYLPQQMSVDLGVYNLQGQVVWQTSPGIQSPGNYRKFIDGNFLSSGIYVLSLQTNQWRWNERITIIK